MMGTEDKNLFTWLESFVPRTDIMYQKKRDDGLTDNCMIFICGPRHLVLSDVLQHNIYHYRDYQEDTLPLNTTMPLTEEITKMGHQLGIFYQNRTCHVKAAKEAAFCAPPYVLHPSNCFNQVYVDGEVKDVIEFSQSLVASRFNHFVILKFNSELIGPYETLRQTPQLECRCVTIKGVVLSTIQIENYYAK
ncbi:hypothetical protein BBBOND_0300830 [Babesia bigemina]|uniref:Uncharacterized protein n=1 Tax=Babesia bigemina TaxID=5866 RepID=A0A061D6J4_BABBI|nr:hypothetical protein BBBOND_0300830 [Babesia bigemina]CDR96178.1 hypothetical protein BBBOND_0300830 [Babesia bigemina]|eukprot:XP_012768364.1 hypothetical protein BBBOND_0300830 [Babesia bigemina]